MTFTEMHVKGSVILADRLAPEILTVLENTDKFCIVCVYISRFLGWLSDLNALLTGKLPTFLSRLNEISGGRGNMCSVSGPLRRILKFLRMSFLIAKFGGWWMRVNGILLVSSFCDVCSAASRSISWARCLPVVTAESG